MSATMNCPKCGTPASGEPAAGAGFSGMKPGGQLPKSAPIAYHFECKNPKCGNVWYPSASEVNQK